MNKYMHMLTNLSLPFVRYNGNLDNKHLMALNTNIKYFIHNTDDGDDSLPDLSAELFSPSILHDKLLEPIYNFYLTLNTGKPKNKMFNLLKYIDDTIRVHTTEKIMTSVSKYDYQTESIYGNGIAVPEQVQRRLQKLRLFALNKLINPKFSPTKKPTINLGYVNELSRKELLEFFSVDSFYRLSVKEINAIMQAVVNNYLAEMGVQTCAVEVISLPYDSNNICYGEYDPTLGCIYMNSNFLNNFSDMKKGKDAYFPYQILTTLIHEATHRVQFYNIDNNHQSLKDRLVNESLLRPQKMLSYSQYLTSLDELDARNSALKYLRESSQIVNNKAMLRNFYNLKVSEEQKLPKNKIPLNHELLFEDIYGASFIPESKNDPINKNFYNSVINQSVSSQPSL